MHTTLCTCSPLRVPPGTRPLPRGGEEGSSVNDAQCEAGLKHSCQARASLDAPRRPEGRRRNKESGGTRPWRHPRGGGTAPNDTHDCTTAPIINGRLPLHLQGRKPARCPSRQPHKPSAFPGLTRVVTNHQRMLRRAPPFRSMRLTPEKEVRNSSWTLNT